MPQDDIRNLDELKNVLAEDARFATFQVTATGDGWLEVRVGEGGLTLAAARLVKEPEKLEPHLVRSAAGKTMLLLVGSDDEYAGIEGLRDRYELALVTLPLSRARLYVTMKNYLDLVMLRARDFERGRVAERYKSELGELVSIARAISSERDIGKLLGLILERSRYVTGADAGSVYIVEGQSLNPRERTVRFMVSQNDSVQIDFSEHTFPVDDKTVVGRAIIQRQLINIPDLAREKVDRRFDRSSGYQTRSMLTVPMINQRDEVIGVIQLINKRKEGSTGRLKAPIDFDDEVVPFDKRSEELLMTLAAQAGISLENTLLYEDIRRLFEGFVNASVTAIESRDPTTSGHSQRVATLTVGLAEMVDRTDGPYQSVHFTADDLKEIEYAALLHDFGKVGVREKVLVKAKKLYEDERETLLSRFDYIRKWVESDALKRKVDILMREGATGAQKFFAELDSDEKQRLGQLDEFVAFILKSNEPTVLAEGSFERLAEIAQHRYTDPRGESHPFLTAGEIDALKLPRGSLTAQERLEIESHVVHTYNFLENIPWGRRLGAIPTIAGSHHEKIDGTGYPRGLKGAEIRVESRMMTIADIFDALTASDRPYKKAVPVDKALDIIGFEVKDGKCDKELLRIFIESKVWQRVIPG
ncbi:MAG: Response regulator [Myxococcales bacterium]|nr:Response regulator [Myxococcales bacterium]